MDGNHRTYFEEMHSVCPLTECWINSEDVHPSLEVIGRLPNRIVPNETSEGCRPLNSLYSLTVSKIRYILLNSFRRFTN
jgi:hypothetical protein